MGRSLPPRRKLSPTPPGDASLAGEKTSRRSQQAQAVHARMRSSLPSQVNTKMFDSRAPKSKRHHNAHHHSRCACAA
jgi:hypothetical protein